MAVVDDDLHLRTALASLLKASEYTVHTFATAESFLEFGPRAGLGCLVLDVRLPAMSGLDLQQRLISEDNRCPIVFISAHDDPQARARAITAGGAAFLLKPVNGRTLLREIDGAVRRTAGLVGS